MSAGCKSGVSPADGERDHRYDRDNRRARQRAQGKTDVGQQVLPFATSPARRPRGAGRFEIGFELREVTAE